MPHELFSRPAFSLTPESGRTGPKLWVRRLAIWREPNSIIRDIPLKPGLNIIWSPDSETKNAPIGHGSGKTSFCRLLRFCLGEDSFAPDELRHRIGEMFPKGYVGAEIILDDELWVVLRGLGERRRDTVIRDGSLDTAFQIDLAPTGIEPLRQAFTKAIISDAVKTMPRDIGEQGAWKALLAWVTRDQECRFSHPLSWRDPNSDSLSPVRHLSNTDRLFIVRALIGALTANEIDTQQNEEIERNNLSAQRTHLSRLKWQIERMRKSLVESLGETAGLEPSVPMEALAFKNAASQRLQEALKMPVEYASTDLARARLDRDAARDTLRELERELREVASAIEEKRNVISMIRGELPEAYAQTASEKNPVCPICKVRIDKVLAEGCGISRETCDLHALQVEIARKEEAIEKTTRDLQSLRDREPALRSEIAAAQQEYSAREKTRTALEQAADGRSRSVRAAQRMIDEADRYESLLAERDSADVMDGTIERRLEATRNSLSAYREAASASIQRLSGWFDAILGELVPGEVLGEAKLDGNGLSFRVQMGGDRSTSAIDSLKVVAFDLACLVMSIEGKTFLPSFLVHDSPREADLSRSIYQRLFEFAAKLQGHGKTPLFQYILTTTTAPPDAFQSAPWVRLKIRGAPASERLLQTDL
jgi:predicted  nucleic acid-binding Zn-ribbon protein